MSGFPETPVSSDPDTPFRHSWIDRLVVWVNQLPGSRWLFYLLSVLGLMGLINVIFWIDGSLPLGTVDLELSGFGPFVVYWLGLYDYLTDASSRSLRTFRPLLAADDGELARIHHELTALPRWIGWLSIPLGLAMSVTVLLSDPVLYGDLDPQSALPYVADIALTGFSAATFFCLVIRSVRQLRMVRKLHARASQINLLKLDPAHAFSALTARTGVGIIALIIISLVYDPDMSQSAVSIASTGSTLLLALVVFVVPVIGLREKLEEEKRLALDEISDLLLAASDRLHNRLRGDDYRQVGETKEAIEALIRQRELYKSISTWPWNPSTLRGFASALLLPIFLWLVTRLLDSLLS